MSKQNDEALISALITTSTIRAAALKAGVSVKSIYNRLKDEAFSQRYQEARTQLVQESIHALQSSTMTAIAVMHDVMTNKQNSAQVRLNAADAIVKNNIKLTEQYEVLTRLKKLEEWQTEKKKHESY